MHRVQLARSRGGRGQPGSLPTRQARAGLSVCGEAEGIPNRRNWRLPSQAKRPRGSAGARGFRRHLGARVREDVDGRPQDTRQTRHGRRQVGVPPTGGPGAAGASKRSAFHEELVCTALSHPCLSCIVIAFGLATKSWQQMQSETSLAKQRILLSCCNNRVLAGSQSPEADSSGG